MKELEGPRKEKTLFAHRNRFKMFFSHIQSTPSISSAELELQNIVKQEVDEEQFTRRFPMQE